MNIADKIEGLAKAEYLIRKGGYFYRPKSRGYTTSPLEAGRYTLEQATKETHPNGPDGPRDGLSHHHVSEFPELRAQEPPADVSGLVEKLLRRGNRYDDGASMHGELANPDGPEAAATIAAQASENARLRGILEAIVAMQALRYGDATRTHMALIGLCVTAREVLGGGA